jgi:hypothetical protein
MGSDLYLAKRNAVSSYTGLQSIARACASYAVKGLKDMGGKEAWVGPKSRNNLVRGMQTVKFPALE